MTCSSAGFSRTGAVLSIAVIGLSLGVLLAVFLSGDSLGDLRSRAWSGAQVNTEALRARLGGLAVPGAAKSDPNPVKKRRGESAAARETKELFHSLTRTYYTAEVQNISDPVVGVTGTAFLAYDKDLNKTLIYSRVENMPAPETGALALWIANDFTDFRRVGIAEFTQEENGKPVAYSVFSGAGDLRVNDELLFSYDSSLDIASPEAVVLRLQF